MVEPAGIRPQGQLHEVHVNIDGAKNSKAYKDEAGNVFIFRNGQYQQLTKTQNGNLAHRAQYSAADIIARENEAAQEKFDENFLNNNHEEMFKALQSNPDFLAKKEPAGEGYTKYTLKDGRSIIFSNDGKNITQTTIIDADNVERITHFKDNKPDVTQFTDIHDLNHTIKYDANDPTETVEGLIKNVPTKLVIHTNTGIVDDYGQIAKNQTDRGHISRQYVNGSNEVASEQFFTGGADPHITRAITYYPNADGAIKSVTDYQYDDKGKLTGTEVRNFEATQGVKDPNLQNLEPATTKKFTPEGQEVVNNTHTVIAGETLSKIARDNNTTVAELIKLNPELARYNGNRIYVNQEIKLPTTVKPAAAEPAPEEEMQYMDNGFPAQITQKYLPQNNEATAFTSNARLANITDDSGTLRFIDESDNNREYKVLSYDKRNTVTEGNVIFVNRDAQGNIQGYALRKADTPNITQFFLQNGDALYSAEETTIKDQKALVKRNNEGAVTSIAISNGQEAFEYEPTGLLRLPDER